MTEQSPDAPTRGPAVLWRLLPLAALGLLIAIAYGQGWHRALTLENLYLHRMDLSEAIEGHIVLAVLVYMAVYVMVVALSLPGALLLTVTGGFLFGWMIGAPAALVAATLGAVIIFLVARTSLGPLMAERSGPAIARLREGFRADAFNYLLFLRLVPAFPFFVVNLAAGILGVSLPVYLAATIIGIIPGGLAFSLAGAGLDSVFAAQGEGFEECAEQAAAAGIADPVAAGCRLAFDVHSLVSWQVAAAFAALGVVALLPILARRWRAGRAGGTSGAPPGGGGEGAG
ncbi:MAG: VTT domain-containing protein [Hyphomicrobiaceae bacterium]